MNMPVFEQIIATAPDAARELFSAYRENRDANERVKLKVKIKVLLDILSLDTVMPPLPEPAKAPIHPAAWGYRGERDDAVNNGLAIGNANAPRLGQDPQYAEPEVVNPIGAPAHANGNHGNIA